MYVTESLSRAQFCIFPPARTFCTQALGVCFAACRVCSHSFWHDTSCATCFRAQRRRRRQRAGDLGSLSESKTHRRGCVCSCVLVVVVVFSLSDTECLSHTGYGMSSVMSEELYKERGAAKVPGCRARLCRRSAESVRASRLRSDLS